jgi:hypothetical protein
MAELATDIVMEMTQSVEGALDARSIPCNELTGRVLIAIAIRTLARAALDPDEIERIALEATLDGLSVDGPSRAAS